MNWKKLFSKTILDRGYETASVGVVICSNLWQTAVLCDSFVVCLGVLWQLSATIKTK